MTYNLLILIILIIVFVIFCNCNYNKRIKPVESYNDGKLGCCRNSVSDIDWHGEWSTKEQCENYRCVDGGIWNCDTYWDDKISKDYC